MKSRHDWQIAEADKGINGRVSQRNRVYFTDPSTDSRLLESLWQSNAGEPSHEEVKNSSPEIPVASKQSVFWKCFSLLVRNVLTAPDSHLLAKSTLEVIRSWLHIPVTPAIQHLRAETAIVLIALVYHERHFMQTPTQQAVNHRIP